MASRLEAATKQFGVPMLLSGDLVRLCSNEMQKQLRQVDTVTVKGCYKPLDLYTCDINVQNLVPEND